MISLNQKTKEKIVAIVQQFTKDNNITKEIAQKSYSKTFFMHGLSPFTYTLLDSGFVGISTVYGNIIYTVILTQLGLKSHANVIISDKIKKNYKKMLAEIQKMLDNNGQSVELDEVKDFMENHFCGGNYMATLDVIDQHIVRKTDDATTKEYYYIKPIDLTLFNYNLARCITALYLISEFEGKTLDNSVLKSYVPFLKALIIE